MTQDCSTPNGNMAGAPRHAASSDAHPGDATHPLLAWLATQRAQDGMLLLGDARPFFHDEATYTAHHGEDPAPFDTGQGLAALLRGTGADMSAPALEIGCGFGYLSLGLAKENPFPLLLLTDTSPGFLRILGQRLDAHGVAWRADDNAPAAPGMTIPGMAGSDMSGPGTVRLGILSGDAMQEIPDASLSCIAMRATLHHVADVDAFLAQAARVLRPGGHLVFEEPCREALLLMGVLVAQMPELAAARGVEVTPRQLELIDLFRRMVEFYCRQDIDKSTAEDKHLFHPVEIAARCRAHGFDTAVYANTTLASLKYLHGESPLPPTFFHDSTRTYIGEVCRMPELVPLFDATIAASCAYIDDCSRGGRGPHYISVFDARRV
ncbi:class I SAM-dependent methyltransferase [Nitratidesulfovibrio sp. SRB-5]|uniref:class I SAM-dependent methyltransferase n=1 Tax=Nitratidesulfovibrio sp. SRB-5 TaxID=2872636 RepID=UPI001025C9EC|nr:class I SAM-dependent methyltransferase [Nitratidesulfovibrio sp. SRB-5]MBZ2172003.1 methyltransferase domain-containing protein [Nitratidesulfovibrio sp. SRB-5]RXF78519.1 class I SAM-dependent methyltransferase [Desulfovibrio sp. DS-1]